jgi:hypothetical protein
MSCGPELDTNFGSSRPALAKWRARFRGMAEPGLPRQPGAGRLGAQRAHTRDLLPSSGPGGRAPGPGPLPRTPTPRGLRRTGGPRTRLNQKPRSPRVFGASISRPAPPRAHTGMTDTPSISEVSARRSSRSPVKMRTRRPKAAGGPAARRCRVDGILVGKIFVRLIASFLLLARLALDPENDEAVRSIFRDCVVEGLASRTRPSARRDA